MAHLFITVALGAFVHSPLRTGSMAGRAVQAILFPLWRYRARYVEGHNVQTAVSRSFGGR